MSRAPGVPLVKVAQEIQGFVLEYRQVLRRVVKLEFAARDRVGKGRLLRSAVVVGSQCDDHIVGLEGKIIKLARTPVFLRGLTGLRPAELVVDPGQVAVGVVVPAAVNAPAALGNQLILSVQSVGDEAGVVIGRTEAHGHPFHKGLRASAALTAGQAVAR